MPTVIVPSMTLRPPSQRMATFVSVARTPGTTFKMEEKKEICCWALR